MPKKTKVSIPADLSHTECHARMVAVKEAMDALEEEERLLREKRAELSSERAQLQNRINDLKSVPNVSDHAVLRYLERRYDFDSDAIRDEIMTPQMEAAIRSGARGLKVDGGTFKFTGMTVTTYLLPEGKARARDKGGAK